MEAIIYLMKNKKKIGFYCSSISWGGLEMNMVRYAKWMLEYGWQTVIFCVANSSIDKKAEEKKIETVHIKKNGKYFDIINVYRVNKLFQQHEISIAWFSDNRDMSLLGLVKKLSSKKLSLFYRQAMRLGIEKKDFLHTIRFNRIDAWVATLPYMAKEVLAKTKLNPNQLFQVALGIDQERFQNPDLTLWDCKDFFGIKNKEKISIGIIGRLDPLKGQLFVLESVAKMIQNGFDIQLLIVGESTLHEGSDYKELLLAKINEHKLENHVIIHPFINQTEYFYNAIDIFVMASEGETFGMVTIEAMSSGCTIIGTDNAGTPEILGQGEYGMLYEYNNETDFDKKLTELYNNSELRKELSSNAQDRAAKVYSKEGSCLGYSAILEKIR